MKARDVLIARDHSIEIFRRPSTRSKEPRHNAAKIDEEAAYSTS